MRALAGIDVVSLAVNIPGPVMVARLAEYGASVTKIEPPEGDPLHHHDPRWYARLTDSQTILRLDLKTCEGRTALDARLSGADLLVTASRPSSLSRLGLDVASLRARFPELCQLQIVGFPAPDDDLPGHDLSFQAAAGLIVDPPRMPFTLLADLMGAERAATEAVAMLLHRQRTGEATCRQVSLAEAAKPLAMPRKGGLCDPKGPLGGASAGYALYRTKDGWVALAALEPRFVERLTATLKIPSLSAARLRKIFAARTSARWESWGERHGIPVTRLRRSGR
ncbi:MAG TPA: CoA transferase [Candidatus Polarisedimenticolaceae bacterium]